MPGNFAHLGLNGGSCGQFGYGALGVLPLHPKALMLAVPEGEIGPLGSTSMPAYQAEPVYSGKDFSLSLLMLTELSD